MANMHPEIEPLLMQKFFLSFKSLQVGENLLMFLIIALATITLIFLCHFLLSLLKHPYMQAWTLPCMKAPLIMLHFIALKAIYKSDNKNCPPVCLVLQVLCGVCRLFEKERIVRLCLGFQPVVVLFKPEMVEVVLNNSTLLDKAREYKFLHSWLGTGLLTSTGEKWRYRRKLLTPTFHFTILEDFIPVFNEQSNICNSKLKTLSSEPWVDVVPLMTALTLDIICETAMGIHIDAQSGGSEDYVHSIYEVADIFLYRTLRPWLQPDIIFNLSPSGRKFNKSTRRVQEFTRKVIKEKKESMLAFKFNNNISSKEEVPLSPNQTRKRRAFLEMLLEHHFKDPSFTEEDIREEVDTFMFAGHDTTAMSISWTLYFLGLDDDVQNTVHDELDGIFQNDGNREVTREDLSQMKYLECVIKETLRLLPTVPFIGRGVDKSFKISNHTIHKGSVCLIVPMVLHQDPENFVNPEKFIPERFFPENSVRRHPYAYVPFSAGIRNCIGQKFALIEEKAVIANILRKFRVRSLDPRDKVNVYPNLVTRNVQPVRLRFTARK